MVSVMDKRPRLSASVMPSSTCATGGGGSEAQPPYGLCVDPDSKRLTPDAETSVYARLIADEALSGSPLVRIARLLNENGIPSPRGGLWQVGSLSQLLKAPAFAGLLPETETVWDEERGRRKYTGVVKPYRDPATGGPVVVGEGIVTVEEQKRITAALESRTRLRGDGVKHPVRASVHLVTGLRNRRMRNPHEPERQVVCLPGRATGSHLSRCPV
ncbi:recombinase family protein [Streptomyces mirabilis]|uniref:recombinase family protein n=1 Tax=Streptomyces mirabilis TaxID=68239 RepID=UPI00332DD453